MGIANAGDELIHISFHRLICNAVSETQGITVDKEKETAGTSRPFRRNSTTHEVELNAEAGGTVVLLQQASMALV